MAPSGTYEVRSSALAAPQRVFCEMTQAGGGWTLLLKVEGSTPTFQFDDPLWTNRALLNPQSANLSPVEAKLAPYVDLPVDELLLGLEVGGTVRYLALQVPRAPLVTSMAGGFVSTQAGRNAWAALVPGSVFFGNCNREGLNVSSSCCAGVRIGILTNQEPDCGSPDMYLGLGARPYRLCGGTLDSSAGSGAVCGGLDTPVEIDAFAFVFGR